MQIISKIKYEVKIKTNRDGSISVAPFILSPADVGEIIFPGETKPARYYDMEKRHVYVVVEYNGKTYFVDTLIKVPRYRSGNKIQRVLPMGLIPYKRYAASVIEAKIVGWMNKVVEEKAKSKSVNGTEKSSRTSLEEKAYCDTTAYRPCLETIMLWVIWFLQNTACFQGHVVRELMDIVPFSANEELKQLLAEIESSHILIYLFGKGKGWLAEAVRLVYYFNGKLLPYRGEMRSDKLIRSLIEEKAAIVMSCVKKV